MDTEIKPQITQQKIADTVSDSDKSSKSLLEPSSFLEKITNGAYQAVAKSWKTDFDLSKCETLEVEFKAIEPDISIERNQGEFVKDVLGLHHANLKVSQIRDLLLVLTPRIQSFLIFGIDEKWNRATSVKPMPEFILDSYFFDSRPTEKFTKIFAGWATAIPSLTYEKFDIGNFRYSVLTIERRPFPIFLVKDHKQATPYGLLLRTLKADGTPEVTFFDKKTTKYQEKVKELNERFYPVLSCMNSSSLVIWLRCPWAKEVPQQFPVGYTMRPDCVLDFGQDLWNLDQLQAHGMEIDRESFCIASPDHLCLQYPQFEYVELLKLLPGPPDKVPDKLPDTFNISGKWISMCVPDPNDNESGQAAARTRRWLHFNKKRLEVLMKAITSRYNAVILFVTAFGDGAWSEACYQNLFTRVAIALESVHHFNCIVLSNKEPSTQAKWISCTAAEFLSNLAHLQILQPRLGNSKVKVNNATKVLSEEQEGYVARYYDVIAVSEGATMVNGITIDEEDNEMVYLRGGGWTWKDCAHILKLNKKFHQEALQTIQRWLMAPSTDGQFCVKIVHKHGEGGSSAAVQLCHTLAETYPVLALKPEVQLTRSILSDIHTAATKLSSSLSSAVIVLLRDMPDSLWSWLPTRVSGLSSLVLIACHALDWTSKDRLQSKRPIPNLHGFEIPLPRSIDQPDKIADMYKQKANQYHNKHKTTLRAGTPSIDGASPFDYSVCAFIGANMSAEAYVENYLSKLNATVKHHLLWIAIIQLYTDIHLNLDWIKDASSLTIFKDQETVLIFLDSKNTIRFCHSYVAKLVFDKILKDIIVLDSIAPFFETLPESTMMEKLLLERHHSEFSPFIARVRSHNQFQTLKLVSSIESTLLWPEVKCHLAILASRLALRSDRITDEEWDTFTFSRDADCTPSAVMANEYATKAVHQADRLQGRSHLAAALAHLGYVKKMQQDWISAALHLDESLKQQPTRCGAMQNLIEVNCQLMKEKTDATNDELVKIWVATVGWFYTLSMDDPRRCSSLSEQLKIIQELKPERNASNANLQIALLQYQAILDKPTEEFNKSNLFNTDSISKSLEYSLSIIYPLMYTKPGSTQHPVFTEIAQNQQLAPFKSANNSITVTCLQQQVSRWLWSKEGWIAIHNRKYWDIDNDYYEAYKIKADQLVQLTNGATLLIGKLDVKERTVRLKVTEGESLATKALLVNVGVYCHMLPEVDCTVLCYVGLPHSSTSSGHNQQIDCWIVDYISV